MTEKDDESIYDKLIKLMENEPEAFEKAKEELIEEFIMEQPEDKREQLRQKQWLIDGELRKYKNPTARLNRMIEMFYEQVRQFQVALMTLEHPEMKKEEKSETKEKAPVIELKKKD